jgi:hypothetical protein
MTERPGPVRDYEMGQAFACEHEAEVGQACFD